jgi:hypothetical protein
MKLSNTAIMNSWCDKIANDTQKTHVSHSDADIYPHEKWALFLTAPTLQKITGKLDDAIIGQKPQERLRNYLQKKKQLMRGKTGSNTLEQLTIITV